MNLSHYWDLVVVLTKKEIKVRYKNNVLGYLWSIANPLAFALVFYLAFKLVMKVQMENYALFLIAGLFPWQWFSNSVGVSPITFLGNGSIIKKVNFPREVVVLAIVLQDMIHFFLSVPVIILFLFIYGSAPSWSWIYGVPVLIFIQTLLTFGVALTLASINLFFRDMEKLTNICLMMLFYLTPVLYSSDMIPPEYQHLIMYNPLAPLMISWRSLLLDGQIIPSYLILSLFYALIAFMFGNFVYRKLSWRFAEVL
jgi:lipopolysaccharide transport system permease protein